jgi:hypothetical protein
LISEAPGDAPAGSDVDLLVGVEEAPNLMRTRQVIEITSLISEIPYNYLLQMQASSKLASGNGNGECDRPFYVLVFRASSIDHRQSTIRACYACEDCKPRGVGGDVQVEIRQAVCQHATAPNGGAQANPAGVRSKGTAQSRNARRRKSARAERTSGAPLLSLSQLA